MQAATNRRKQSSDLPEVGDTSSLRVRALLKMNEAESLQPGPGSDFIIIRLMELILVEILRSEELRLNQKAKGLLAGLRDPITARAFGDA